MLPAILQVCIKAAFLPPPFRLRHSGKGLANARIRPKAHKQVPERHAAREMKRRAGEAGTSAFVDPVVLAITGCFVLQLQFPLIVTQVRG